jgi:poly(A) polymerase
VEEFAMASADHVDTVTVVRKRTEHNVSRNDMDADALRVLYRLIRNGYTAYLVGGGVRDLLLGRKPKDFDVVTNARPRQICKLFRNSFLIGRRFRLVHIKFGNNVIETSTFRRRPDDGPEHENEELYRYRDNTFGTAEEDAWRRDFTINALFYDIASFAIVDHVGGLLDVEQRKIRSLGDAGIRFQEDPVRMVRAVRFASRLDFEIERETYQAILKHANRIMMASAPRLFEEVLKLFPFACGESAFRLLRRSFLLREMFPELDAFLDRGERESQLFWGHLAELDKRSDDAGSVLDPALVFSALHYAPMLEAIAQEEIDSGTHAPLAREVLDGVAVRYRMPKRIQYRCIQVLDGQRRFESAGRRFSRRKFVAQESFSLILALREIHLDAAGGDRKELESWRALHREHGQSDGDSSDRPPPARRRRRGRGGRGPRSPRTPAET